MSECYPTGCTPCTSPIEFPEMPADGDRHCVPIGSNGEQKCWVYDKCIPGWRAEGPATSPTRYRGLINPCSTPPAEDTQAGDWYIISADKADVCIQDPRWGLNLGDFKQGDRIAYNGTTWETFPPPDVPYAEEARDGDKPDPDDRMGGIVKNATVNQAIAGTDRCDSITPYTLNAVVQPIKDSIPEVPDNNATTDDILWEINADDKLTPKDASKEVLVTPRIIGGTTVSVAQRIRIGDDTLPVNDPNDPATSDASVSIVQGTVRCWQAGDIVPAGEQRYCVFDENGYIIPGGNPADTDFGTGAPGQEITINVSGSPGSVDANNGGTAQRRVKDLPSYRFTRGGTFSCSGLNTLTYGNCGYGGAGGATSVSYAVEIRKKDDGQVLARGSVGAGGGDFVTYSCNGGLLSGSISQLIDPGTSVEAEVWIIGSLSDRNTNVRGTHTFFVNAAQIDITT